MSFYEVLKGVQILLVFNRTNEIQTNLGMVPADFFKGLECHHLVLPRMNAPHID